MQLDTKEVALMGFFSSEFVEAVVYAFCQGMRDLLSLQHDLSVRVPNLVHLEFNKKVLTYNIHPKIYASLNAVLPPYKNNKNFREKENRSKWENSIQACMSGEISSNEIQWYFREGRRLKVRQLKLIHHY